MFGTTTTKCPSRGSLVRVVNGHATEIDSCTAIFDKSHEAEAPISQIGDFRWSWLPIDEIRRMPTPSHCIMTFKIEFRVQLKFRIDSYVLFRRHSLRSKRDLALIFSWNTSWKPRPPPDTIRTKMMKASRTRKWNKVNPLTRTLHYVPKAQAPCLELLVGLQKSSMPRRPRKYTDNANMEACAVHTTCMYSTMTRIRCRKLLPQFYTMPEYLVERGLYRLHRNPT